MAAEKIVQIAVADDGSWGILYALTDKGQIFCRDGISVKKESDWFLVDGPDYGTNVKFREKQ